MRLRAMRFRFSSITLSLFAPLFFAALRHAAIIAAFSCCRCFAALMLTPIFRRFAADSLTLITRDATL